MVGVIPVRDSPPNPLRNCKNCSLVWCLFVLSSQLISMWPRAPRFNAFKVPEATERQDSSHVTAVARLRSEKPIHSRHDKWMWQRPQLARQAIDDRRLDRAISTRQTCSALASSVCDSAQNFTTRASSVLGWKPDVFRVFRRIRFWTVVNSLLLWNCYYLFSSNQQCAFI